MKNPFLKKKVKKESSVEKYLIGKVVLLGGVIRKVTFPGHKGASDRLVMFPGKVLCWVELKRVDVKKVSPEQEREHERFAQMGQRVEVIRTEWQVDTLIEELYAESRLAC